LRNRKLEVIMISNEFSPLSALAGGVLIGAAATVLFWSHGKVAGISGILGGIFVPGTLDRPFRFSFLAGLLLGGLMLLLGFPQIFASTVNLSFTRVAAAGLIVGFGTRLGNGCTSGHGVCGITRFSSRSLVATITFMATGFATVFAMRHIFGGS
jgi:uncharacterized protein